MLPKESTGDNGKGVEDFELTLQVKVDAAGGDAAIANSMNDETGAAGTVAARKNTGEVGHLPGIHGEATPAVRGEIIATEFRGRFGIETIGHEDDVGVDNEFGAGDLDGFTASLGIGLAEGHSDAANATDIVVALDGDGIG